MSAPDDASRSITADQTRIETFERGRGRPLLFLHPGIGLDGAERVLEVLSQNHRVIAPSHPGFGGSTRPPSITTVDDLSYFYLDFMDRLGLTDTLIVGVGLGGWVAAEIAVKTTARISHLVLANPIGLKAGGREDRDIVDIWAISQDEFDRLAFFDPNVAKRDYKALPLEAAMATARNRETNALFCWSPYMHNPKLPHRLHRINIPTLVLWGAADRILSEACGRSYCAAIANARFETIDSAGHLPHLEQPDEFARRVLAFARTPAPDTASAVSGA